MQQGRQAQGNGGRPLDWSRSGQAAGNKRERAGRPGGAANRTVSSTSAPANANGASAPRKKRRASSRHDDSEGSDSDDDEGAVSFNAGGNASSGTGNRGPFLVNALGTTYGTLGLGLGVGMQNRL